MAEDGTQSMGAQAGMMARDLGRQLWTGLTRARQFTEETLGTAPKTEYEPKFEHLLARTDAIKAHTERIMKQTQALLQPNPARRIEAVVVDKLNRRPSVRVTDAESLGSAMLETANALGPDSVYASALVRCAQAENRLGEETLHYQALVAHSFLRPLSKFLQGDVKSVNAERKLLSRLRLDLDASRNRARKATGDRLTQAQADLDKTQRAFEQQYEVTKLLLENIQKANDDMIHSLIALVDAQYNFHARAARLMSDAGRELRRMAGVEPGRNEPLAPPPGSSVAAAKAEDVNIVMEQMSSSLPAVPTSPHMAASGPAAGEGPVRTDAAASSTLGEKKTARVLCDYDAMDRTELSLVADEIVLVQKDSSLDPAWVMAERNGQRGKVPVDYLDLE